MSYQYKTLAFSMPAEGEEGEAFLGTCTGCSCTVQMTSACDIEALDDQLAELEAIKAEIAKKTER